MMCFRNNNNNNNNAIYMHVKSLIRSLKVLFDVIQANLENLDTFIMIE